MKKLGLVKTKKFVTFVNKSLLQIKMIKIHLNYTIKLEIIVITQENLEGLLMIFVIKDTKH